MHHRLLGLSIGVALATAIAGWAPTAHADPAIAVVNGFAQPPPGRAPLVLVPPPVYVERYVERPAPAELPHEDYRSPFRLSLGPAGVTTGRGFGMGLGLAADVGTGTVGARFSAAWLRPESSEPGATLGGAFGHYAAELALDLHKAGPWHPLLGVGFGLAHVSSTDFRPGGFAGVGLARLGFEYSFGLDDADVRVGLHLTGALPGPADPDLAGLKGYVIASAGIGIGF